MLFRSAGAPDACPIRSRLILLREAASGFVRFGGIVSLSSNRVSYRELKPYDAPSELAELHGPSGGRIELPLTVYWGPAHVFSLNLVGSKWLDN